MKKNIYTPTAEHEEVKRMVLTAAGGSCSFEFDYNLDYSNTYITAYAAVSGDKLFYCREGGEVECFEIGTADEFVYQNYIGCNSIEYIKDGVIYELLRSDMKNAVTMQTAVQVMNSIRDGRKVEKTDVRICPKCGRILPRGSTICVQCADRKKLASRFLGYAKPYRKQMILAVFISLMASAVTILVPMLNKEMVDGYLNNTEMIEQVSSGASTMTGFWLILGGLVAFGLLTSVLSMMRGIAVSRAGKGILIDIRKQLYEKVQELSLTGISKRSSGELINRITSDTRIIKDNMTGTVPELLHQSIVIISTVVILAIFNWKLTLLVILPVPFLVFLFRSLRHFTGKMYRKQWHLNSLSYTLLHDVFTGMREVKVFGTEKYEEGRFGAAAYDIARISKRNEMVWQLVMPMSFFLLNFGSYAVLVILGFDILDGQSTLGELMQITSYVSILYNPIRWMANVPRRLTELFTSLAKVFEIIDEETDIPEADAPVEADIVGNIEFKHAYFGYNDYEYVLKDINLKINNGEMVGFVGRSGVGKTTAVNLIMRLYDIKLGELTIDGVDIRKHSQHSLRSQIGVVLQETFLFNGTIYSNLVYAKPDAGPEEVVKAAKLANAHEFILKQPDGYNTYVGDRGHTLSGGERQRLAIARAILRNPKILILDEATASLDTETEKLIQDAISKLIEGRTTIAIAHRLSTLRNATKLVVFEKGMIEEVGTHDELMKSGGRYYKLVMAQRQMSKMLKDDQQE